MRTSHIRRGLGRAGVALGTLAWMAWLVGRLADARPHPVWVLMLVTEVVAVVTGVLVALQAGHVPPAGADRPPARTAGRAHGRDVDWYPIAVATMLGLEPGSDPRRAARASWRPALSLATSLPTRTVALVRLEGMRRLAGITGLAVGLLLGVAPFGRPSVGLIAVGVAGLVLTTLGTAALSGGLIRPGDRLCWSFASIGLTAGPPERSDAMPVRWAGVMGSIVIVNMAIALRGASDRWTHGLPPMTDADRVTTLAFALLFVTGGVITLRRLEPPEPGHYRATRQLDERSARQTALGATAVAALVGLVAGILPGAVDAAEPTEREDRSENQVVVDQVEPDASEVGNGLVGRAEVPTQRADQP